MQHILKESGSAQGSEVLFFDAALIEKIKGDSTSFASIGTLNVLYFKSYDRFVLQINDWKYPLLRRLPIVAEMSDKTSRTYIFPSQNGFSYRLTLNYVPSFQALTNFERILYGYSNFYFKDENTPFRKSEVSPDDKLVRRQGNYTGIKETVAQTIKTGIEKVKTSTKTIQSGTLHLTSKKRRTYLKDIKNRNFRRRAHPTFQKGFFEAGEKITREFELERKGNTNFLQEKELKELKSGYRLPNMYINKEELEDLIIDYRDLAARGGYHLTGFKGERGRTEQQRGEKGFMDSLKSGLNEIKHTFSDMLHQGEAKVAEAVGQDKPRTVNPTLPGEAKMTGYETMTHYQA